MWHPWRTAAERYPHITIDTRQQLPRGVRGLWRGTCIWICSSLSQAERRSTLTHELLHVDRGLAPRHARAREESTINELAARKLITMPALTDALRWSRDPHELAEHLWVDPPTVKARMNTLDPLETAELSTRWEMSGYGFPDSGRAPIRQQMHSATVKIPRMRSRIVAAAFAVAAAASMALISPAQADVDKWLTSDRYPTNNDPGCESIPFYGLNPYIRSICDDPIQPDGSWLRYRVLWHPTYVHSTCFGVIYEGGCPNWAKDSRDIVQASRNTDLYVVTADTIPAGEPGHLG